MGTDVAVYDGDTGQEIQLASSTGQGTSSAKRAEIDSFFSEARSRRRSWSRFEIEARSLACRTPEIAASCTYAKPVGKVNGKQQYIYGPSIRLAEILAYAWENVEISTDVIERNERFIVAEAVALDFEKRRVERARVRRSIVDRNGRTYSEGMIANTENAACAIAYRNVVFKTIPRSLIEPIRLAAEQAANDGQTVEQILDKLLAHFAGLGVEDKRVYQAVGVLGRAEMNLEHIGILRAIATNIRDGDCSIDEAFPRPEAPASPPAQSRTDGLAEKMAGGKPRAEPAPKAT